MSLSRPQLKNPASRFFQWRGGAGVVNYYDKAKEETVEVPLPFTFLVLDELNTISGFNDSEKSSFWSNEVRNIQTDELVVRSKSGVKARGLYANLGDVKSDGAKYAKSVYIAFKDETGEMVIGNIKIMGAALTAWIEFQKKFDVGQCAVIIGDKPTKGKKGTVEYFIPEFKGRAMSPDSKAEAVKLDHELQAYLDNYMARKPDTEAVTEDSGYATSAEELNAKPSKQVSADDVVIEDVDPPATEAPKKAVAKPAAKAEGDDTIPLEDVPF